MQEVKDKAQKIVDEIDNEKVKAESKLEAAKPALEEAEAALNVSSDLPTQVWAGTMFHHMKQLWDCCHHKTELNYKWDL